MNLTMIKLTLIYALIHTHVITYVHMQNIHACIILYMCSHVRTVRVKIKLTLRENNYGCNTKDCL